MITACSTSQRSGSSKQRSVPARVSLAPCRCRLASSALPLRRSPFIDKDSQEHFEIRTHKRLIDVLDPDSKTIDTLMRLNLPAGVDIEIKI